MATHPTPFTVARSGGATHAGQPGWLLIVPAAGIMTSSEALLANLPAIAAGLVLSLMVTVPFCGWLMQVLIKRMDRRREERA